MLVHIVLFRPKPNVSERDREAMFAALTTAATEIPAVRRFQIGHRVVHGATYEQMMTHDFPFAAVIAFEDMAGLKAYLEHPKHQKLGDLFYALLEAAMVYDYEVEEL